ncbi:UDP-3-O-[3-hydroxymyristoyl] glucosamine N-acyltransferase [Clostridium sp. DSM 8431]|uniref:hypothetical protein n=1 Tax=Clostridium sp. DSM 8431 TaxID=1761781 RepID=UPI0008E565A9|nr:hypothetical protein [Clostridium sp. DSM 8431]SFU45996.1 UDP-3-O-[3-hydroxymyristoyl] glucosamine N-acyltransferase [Clostridium sp. DSM 8431]
MEVRIETILDYLDITGTDYKYIGIKSICVNKYASIDNLESNCISYIEDKENINNCSFSDVKDALILVPNSMNIVNVSNRINFISCKEPKLNFFSIINEFFKNEDYFGGINKNSTVSSSNIDRNISVGAYCYIGKDVILEDGVVLKNNISIEGKVFIGKNTIINSGTVIGKNSFKNLCNKDGKLIKVQGYGGVCIGENVEIGSNVVIERGSVEDTKIFNNVKIGNGCIISSDSIIEENTIISDMSNV